MIFPNTGTPHSSIKLESASISDNFATSGPDSGPQWDALARSGDSVLLIEAKANVRELNSSPCGAGPASLAKIRATLDETRAFLNVNSDSDWTRCFYQYANRLAHVYLLRELNGHDAYLVFVYFVDDRTTEPVSQSGWRAAVELTKAHLGLPSRIGSPGLSRTSTLTRQTWLMFVGHSVKSKSSLSVLPRTPRLTTGSGGSEPVGPNRLVLRQARYYRYRSLSIAERGGRSN